MKIRHRDLNCYWKEYDSATLACPVLQRFFHIMIDASTIPCKPSGERVVLLVKERVEVTGWWYLTEHRILVVITRKDLEKIYKMRPDLKSAQIYFQMSGGEK